MSISSALVSASSVIQSASIANLTLTGCGSAVSSAKESASVALTSATAAASSAAAASDAGKVALGRNEVRAIGFALVAVLCGVVVVAM